MLLTPDTRADLFALFSSVETGFPPVPGDPLEPLLWTGSPDAGLVFRGRSLELLRQLQRELAGSALAKGGPSRKAVESRLIEACRRSIAEGHDKASSWLEESLREPLEEWLVAEPIDVFLPVERATLGACEISRELPEHIGPDFIPEAAIDDLAGPVISTAVLAQDTDSARLVGRDRIEEARAILILLNRGHREAPRLHLIGRPGVSMSLASGRRTLMAHQLYDEDGRIHPTYAPVSAAAAKEESSRTDWERRTVAAVRWIARASVTTWPSEALIANMVGLECLFVEDRLVRKKGEAIANALTDRVLLKGLSSNEQREWLISLYRRRNDAAHEGRQYAEDLEVDRLTDLAWWGSHWALWHLTTYHHDSGNPCTTFAEAMADHDNAPTEPP